MNSTIHGSTHSKLAFTALGHMTAKAAVFSQSIFLIILGKYAEQQSRLNWKA